MTSFRRTPIRFKKKRKQVIWDRRDKKAGTKAIAMFGITQVFIPCLRPVLVRKPDEMKIVKPFSKIRQELHGTKLLM